MTLEHWAEEEIKSLKAEKERLTERKAEIVDQEERESIWRHAFSEPDKKWRLPARLEEEFRSKGFPDGSTTLVTTGGMSIENHYLRFQRNLVRGACEYLMEHTRDDNRMTVQRIYEVLRSSKEFGGFINYPTVWKWISGATPGFEDLVEEYAIDQSPSKTIYERYARAIREWWLKNPSDDVKPTYSAIAKILKLTPQAVGHKVTTTQALQKLMRERPSEKENE